MSSSLCKMASRAAFDVVGAKGGVGVVVVVVMPAVGAERDAMGVLLPEGDRDRGEGGTTVVVGVIVGMVGVIGVRSGDGASAVARAVGVAGPGICVGEAVSAPLMGMRWVALSTRRLRLALWMPLSVRNKLSVAGRGPR